MAGGTPVGNIVLKPVRARGPGRLCGAILAACKPAAVWVIIARALQAAIYVLRSHSSCADEIDVDDPGGARIAQALSSHNLEAPAEERSPARSIRLHHRKRTKGLTGCPAHTMQDCVAEAEATQHLRYQWWGWVQQRTWTCCSHKTQPHPPPTNMVPPAAENDGNVTMCSHAQSLVKECLQATPCHESCTEVAPLSDALVEH